MARKAGSAPRPLAAVTGASGGIGAAFAERLASDGYDLIAVARSRQKLQRKAAAMRRRYGVRVEVAVADLTCADAVRDVERRLAGASRLDLLVNNAGFGTAGTFWELDADIEEAEIRLNVLALMRLTRAVLPGMVARRNGAIINVSSLISVIPNPTVTTYGATKKFVNAFTESLAEELRGTGVRVQALCPGFTRTGFQDRAGIDAGHVPEIAWMDPEDVVTASLSALERGELICIPGTANRLLANLAEVVPRGLLRRMAGAGSRRFFR